MNEVPLYTPSAHAPCMARKSPSSFRVTVCPNISLRVTVRRSQHEEGKESSAGEKEVVLQGYLAHKKQRPP